MVPFLHRSRENRHESSRPLVVLGYCRFHSCVVFGACADVWPPSQGEVPSTGSGRYQFVVAGERGNAVYVFEPATGQCWYRETNPAIKTWTEMGSPTIRSQQGEAAVQGRGRRRDLIHSSKKRGELGHSPRSAHKKVSGYPNEIGAPVSRIVCLSASPNALGR